MAVALRLLGFTFPEIEKQIGIARGTLNGWFKNLELSKKAKERILNRKKEHLKTAREQARKSNQNLLSQRYVRAQRDVEQWVSDVPLSRGMLGFTLAALYLGEGAKRKSTLIFANSNSAIIKLYIHLLDSVFNTEIKRYRVVLGLRMDQDPTLEMDYWTKITGIPTCQFKKTQFDQRTIGKKTFPNYHGVCTVVYNDAEAEKRLTILQQKLIDSILGT